MAAHYKPTCLTGFKDVMPVSWPVLKSLESHIAGSIP